MKYQVIKGCVINAQPRKAGDVVEIDDLTARDLLGIGRIAPYDEPVVENRSVGLSASEERPRRRGRPPKAPVDDLMDD